MAAVALVTTRHPWWPAWSGRVGRVIAATVLSGSLIACSTGFGNVRTPGDLPPLQLEDRSIPVSEVAVRAPTPDLLALDDEMREFVRFYAGRARHTRQRLNNLHRAVIGAGALDLQYDPFAGGTAQEVFRRGSANCLSFASLFVALAREAGLNADYQWLEMRPQWTRMGERVMVRLHVNVVVKQPGDTEYMVDIDPLPRRQIVGSKDLTDKGASALYHSNIAMDALAHGDLEQAWLHGVRALQLSPTEPHLWVNLGAVYRVAGQHRVAERNYLYALRLDPWERSAMNNLVVLYGMEGREQERQRWLARVTTYRDRNPYFHAWLGDQAADEGDWIKALQYYQEALDMLPGDASLLYAIGLIYSELDDLQEASGYVERAIERATIRSELETYRLQLEALQRRQLAGG